MDIVYQPIGIIHSPFLSVEHMPIQPVGAAGIRGEVELFAEFVAGLQDLEGFSHIILLYHFHRVGAPRLIVTPFLDLEPHGVFATRAPTRPNSIGLSVVKLLSVEGTYCTSRMWTSWMAPPCWTSSPMYPSSIIMTWSGPGGLHLPMARSRTKSQMVASEPVRPVSTNGEMHGQTNPDRDLPQPAAQRAQGRRRRGGVAARLGAGR